MPGRHQKFNGLRRSSFPAFLKETEFRFNNRNKDFYKILLKSCTMNPLWNRLFRKVRHDTTPAAFYRNLIG